MSNFMRTTDSAEFLRVAGHREFQQLAEQQQLTPESFRKREQPATVVQAFQLTGPWEVHDAVWLKGHWVVLEDAAFKVVGPEQFGALYEVAS